MLKIWSIKMTCMICHEEMDMEEFGDERDGTETCFKLGCGHSYHTRCVISFMERTKYKCVACNQEQAPEQKLELDGIIDGILREMRKNDEYRVAKHEYCEARKEYKEVVSKWRKRCDEFVRQCSSELKLPEHRSYYLSTKSNLKRITTEEARKKGTRYVGALNSKRGGYRYGHTVLEEFLFGQRWPEYSLLHPRLRTTI